MCDHGCHGVNDCAHDREQDTWIVSDRPASTETARPANLPASDAEPVHGPTLTRAGFTEALTRDGGADPYTRGVRRGW